MSINNELETIPAKTAVGFTGARADRSSFVAFTNRHSTLPAGLSGRRVPNGYPVIPC